MLSAGRGVVYWISFKVSGMASSACPSDRASCLASHVKNAVLLLRILAPGTP